MFSFTFLPTMFLQLHLSSLEHLSNPFVKAPSSFMISYFFSWLDDIDCLRTCRFSSSRTRLTVTFNIPMHSSPEATSSHPATMPSFLAILLELFSCHFPQRIRSVVVTKFILFTSQMKCKLKAGHLGRIPDTVEKSSRSKNSLRWK